MIWKFINSSENSGKFNMDFDIFLAENCEPDTAVLRLYRWQPYCISLGANQSFDDINLSEAKYNKIGVVKRPTGGRAILHSQELTYSVIYPITADTSAKNFYNEINLALKAGLIHYDSILSKIELEHSQPDLREFYKKDISSICFAVSAKSELNFDSKKLVGSAQRKMGNVLLQHGSILCGDHHKKIIDYLNVDDFRKLEILNEMNRTTIDLKSILSYKINYSKLSLCIRQGFEDHFKVKMEILDHTKIDLTNKRINQVS